MKCCYVTHCDLPCTSSSWNPVLLHLFVSIKNENEDEEPLTFQKLVEEPSMRSDSYYSDPDEESSTESEADQETHLGIENLIYPVFLKDGNNIKEEIPSLPNIHRWSVDLLLSEIESCLKLGIRVFDVFPSPLGPGGCQAWTPKPL